MKNKFSLIIDSIFVGAIAFIIALVLFNFFIPYPFTLIYSAGVALLLELLYVNRTRKKHGEAKFNKTIEKEKERLLSELNFSDRSEQLSIIEKALKNAGLSYQKKTSSIIIKDRNIVILTKFSFNKITKADIVKAFNVISLNQTAYILAQDFEGDIISFAERFNGKIKLVDGQKLYDYLKENDAMPEEYKYERFTEKKRKASFKNLLDKKKAKTFFVFGGTFLLFSYFSPLKLYYIICGCLFLIYSLVLRLFGKSLKITEQNADNI